MVLLFQYFHAFAFDTNGNFGFKQQDTQDGYQQYVGQTFFVRRAYGTLETWKKSGFEYDKSYYGKFFKITKITTKDVQLNDKPNREVSVTAREEGGKAKIKFKAYEEVSTKIGFWGDIKKWPLISCMPIVFTEPFNAYKAKHIGETITHDIVKDSYEITNVFMGAGKDKGYETAEPNVTVRNKRTGDTLSCTYSQVKDVPFAKALTGQYKTSLIKVERPDNSNERYGETKTIQDEGVDKFSYIDNNIDITIFGTKEQFDFTLKNVSEHSLKLIWNEAAFVGLDGTSSKIMHTGIKYSEREKDQPATTIIKGAKIEDCATPITNVYYDEGYKIGYNIYGNGWKTKSMLPTSYQGKEPGVIQLMLPIQIKNVVNEYTFVFKVYYTYDHPELLNTEKL